MNTTIHNSIEKLDRAIKQQDTVDQLTEQVALLTEIVNRQQEEIKALWNQLNYINGGNV